MECVQLYGLEVGEKRLTVGTPSEIRHCKGESPGNAIKVSDSHGTILPNGAF